MLTTKHSFDQKIMSFLKDPKTLEDKVEVSEGNKILGRFMDDDVFRSNNTFVGIDYNKSLGILIKVSLKIISFTSDSPSWLDGHIFNYRHMMFHEVLDFDNFYRRTVQIVKDYNKWVSEQESE